MILETTENVSREREQSAVLNSNVKLHKMKRDKCSLDLASWRSIVTLTGAILIMCGARRKPGWGLLRKECEMKKFDCEKNGIVA